MKTRGIIVIDMESRDILSAAQDHELLQELLKSFREKTKSKVEWSDSLVRERRGNSRPDLASAKFRNG